MNYVLILGGGNDQIPAIRECQILGFKTIVVDINKSCPGKSIADIFISESNRNANGIIKSLKKMQIAQEISTIIVMGSDVPHVAAKIAKALDIAYFLDEHSAEIATNKIEMKKFLIEQKIITPTFKVFDSEDKFFQSLRLQDSHIVIKPESNSGSRGVWSLSRELKTETIKACISDAFIHSQNNKVLMEKRVFGDQLSVEAIFDQEEISIGGFALRNYEMNECFFPKIIENGGIQPYSPHFDRLEEVKNIVRKIKNGLKLKYGTIKLDLVICADSNEIQVIEFALRLSGGNFSSHIIGMSIGVNFLRNAIKCLSRMTTEPLDVKNFKKIYANRYFFRVGAIEEIKLPVGLGLVENAMLKDVGSFISEINTHGDRAGYFIVCGDSVDEVNQKVNATYLNEPRYKRC